MNPGKPINVLIQEFLSELDKSSGTKRLYRKTLEYFVTWSVKNDGALGNSTKADIIGYKNSLITSGISPATIDNYMSSLRKFFGWLNECEYIEVNPTESIAWLRDRNGTFIKSALTIDQVFNLLESVHKESITGLRNYAFINLMCFTGLRCIEVTRLNIGDLKRAANKWRLQIQRKGSNEKSGMITIPNDLIHPIQRYLEVRSDMVTEDTPMFTNHAPRSMNTRITPVTISRIIKAGLIRIGLNSNRYTAHSLRHTAATLAYRAGSENWEIQRLLGHKNPRQTEHYIRSLGIDSGEEGKATFKINEFMKKYQKTFKTANY